MAVARIHGKIMGPFTMVNSKLVNNMAVVPILLMVYLLLGNGVMGREVILDVT
jgi:hypothetical protein